MALRIRPPRKASPIANMRLILAGALGAGVGVLAADEVDLSALTVSPGSAVETLPVATLINRYSVSGG